MIKRIAIFLITDIVLLAVFVLFLQMEPGGSLIVIIIVPFLFIINIIPGILLEIRGKTISKILIANSFAAPLIFYGLMYIWFLYYHETHFDNYNFQFNNRAHQLTIYKKSDHFGISDISTQNQGFTSGLMFGKYTINNDSIILIDDQKKCFVVNSKLYDFKESSEPLNLQKAE